MDIEKTLVLSAPAERVWALLLDPQVMGACVPGMQSIEVISDVEYVAHIHVKIAFISAKFKIKTIIAEQRAPHYLRTVGTGEDASVASSLKQASEIFLTPQADGQTEVRMKIHVDVLGRLGTFGLSVMKTKSDRMWDDFAVQLTQRIAPTVAVAAVEAVTSQPATAASVAITPVPAVAADTTYAASSTPVSGTARPAMVVTGTPPATGRKAGWWAHLLGALGGAPVTSAPVLASTHIHVELRRGDTILTVNWPLQGAAECAAWLRECKP
jgi:uncharacterized protein